MAENRSILNDYDHEDYSPSPSPSQNAKSNIKKKENSEPSRKRKIARKWTYDEIDRLLELYEERPIIWDIYNKGYHKREKRAVAFSELSGELEIDVADIKIKVNSLRAQLGREIAKVNKTKSGQATSE